MKKKRTWLKVIAIVTAVAGAAFAIGSYLKKKSDKISEELDFDNTKYFDDDELFSEDAEEFVDDEDIDEEYTITEDDILAQDTLDEDLDYILADQDKLDEK